MNLIKKILIIIFIIISLGFLPMTHHKVHALTNTTIYSTENNGTLSDSGRFKYSPSSLGLIFSSSTASLNTLVNSGSYGIQFWYYQSITTSNTYTLQLNFNDYDLYSKFDSSYVKIYVYNGDDVNQASIINVTKSNKSTNYKTLTIKFISATVGTYLRVELQKEGDDSFYIKFLGPDNFRLNSVQVDSSQSEGTDLIINNATNNTQNIINNDNSNTQNIIDNQNQNTQDLIDAQKVCKNYDKTDIAENGMLLSDGTKYQNNFYGITDYISIKGATIKTSVNFGTSSSAYYCFYNVNKTMISCTNLANTTLNETLTIPTDADYFRTSIQLELNKPQFEICKNGNQAVNDSLNDLNKNLTDTSSVDMNSLGNTAGWLPAGPIDSIVNLPLTMLNNIFTALSGTCSPLLVTIPFIHTQTTIPCLSSIFGQINGVTEFWTWVGTIASIIILYSYFINLYNYYDRLTTLQANYLDDFGGTP